MPKAPNLSKTDWLPVVVVLVAALAIRIVFSLNVRVVPAGDAGAYVRHAQNLLEYGVFGIKDIPYNERAVLYPAILAAISKVFSVPLDYWTFFALNLVLDTISLVLLCVVGRRVAGTPALYGVLLMALNPIWFGEVNTAVTEPISVTLFLLFLEAWTRPGRTGRQEIVAGTYLGLLILARSMFMLLPIAILLVERLAAFLRREKHGVAAPMRIAVFLVAAYFLPVLWGFRNLISLGTFTLAQNSWGNAISAWTAIKIPLFDWHNPEHAAIYSNHPWSFALLGNATQAQQVEIEKLMWAEVREFILNQPFQYLWMMTQKAARLWLTGWWNPFSYVHSPRYLGPIYMWAVCAPVLLFGTIGLTVSRSKISQAKSAQATLILYITTVTFPFMLDARYTIVPFVLFSIWVPAGVAWCLGKR